MQDLGIKRIRLKYKNYPEKAALIIILVLLMCQVALFYIAATRQSKTDYISDVAVAVGKLKLGEEYDKAQIDNGIVSVVADEDVIRLVNDDVLGELKALSLSVRLNKYMAVSDSVKKLYLYKKNTNKLLDLYEMAYEVGNNSADGILKQLQEKDDLFNELLQIESVDINGLMTNRYFYVYSPDRTTKDLLLVELKPESVKNDHRQCQDLLKGQLIVAGDEGEVLYGGSEFPVGTLIDQEEFFARCTTYESNFMGDYSGEKCLIYHEYSYSLKRWYLVITPMKKILKFGFDQQFVFMYLSILVAFATILRCYSWFGGLRKSVAASMTKLSQHSKKVEEGLKKNNLLQYLTGTLKTIDHMEQYFEGHFQSDQEAAVLIMRIDNGEEEFAKYSEKDMEIIAFGINNICQELLENSGLASYYIRKNGNCFEYILGNIHEAEFQEQYQRFVMRSREELEKHVSLKTSYYISAVHPLEEIRDCYEEAQAVQEYIFVYGSGNVLDSKVLVENSEIRLNNAKLICDEIEKSIVKMVHNEREIYGQLATVLQDMSVSDIRELLFYLLIRIYSAAELLKQRNEIITSFDITAGLNYAEKVTYLSDFHAYIYESFRMIEEQRMKIDDNRSYTMIKKCNECIESDFGSETLCLTYIAERIGVTDNYLGRKYKQITGKTIANVITEKRLAEASRLLIESDKTVKQIMELVGYSNSSYFSAAFKKWYGVTPVVYRQNKKNTE